MKKRHFIVFHTAESGDGSKGCGSQNITTTDGSFPNSKDLNQLLINKLQELSPDKIVLSVCITNIIELNENDFNNWIK